MRVDQIRFGPFVNASEQRAYEYLSRELKAEPGTAHFVILTNIAHSVSSGGQSDEIDLIIVCSTAVHVIEVKHWDRAYVRSNRDIVVAEADKLALKVRKVAIKLRRKFPQVGYISPKMLLTRVAKVSSARKRRANSRSSPLRTR